MELAGAEAVESPILHASECLLGSQRAHLCRCAALG